MHRRRREAELNVLKSENERLRQENAELRETFDHLHRSAQLWVRLYERQLPAPTSWLVADAASLTDEGAGGGCKFAPLDATGVR
jgi:predicted nuclease with TOPRIM domain